MVTESNEWKVIAGWGFQGEEDVVPSKFADLHVFSY